MSDDIWDDEELQVDVYAKFKKMGDSVSGGITAIGKAPSFPDDKRGSKMIPQLVITTDSGEEVLLAAGQLDLRLQLLQLRPKVGDHIFVQLINQPKPGEEKKFKVEVNS